MNGINDIKTANGKQKYYKGFGTYKTASGWAKALGLPRMTVWQYLQAGKTPEEIVDLREVKNVKLDDPGRKERVGHRQVETLELMEALLDFSDYDTDDLKVDLIGGAYRHRIMRDQNIIGVYNPTTDVLQLTGGDKIKLRAPFVEDQRIHHINGIWHLTPETKRAMLAKRKREL